MKPKFEALLDKCIEDGINSGWARAHKHTENPDGVWIREQMHQAIMFELYEWFEFDSQQQEEEKHSHYYYDRDRNR